MLRLELESVPSAFCSPSCASRSHLVCSRLTNIKQLIYNYALFDGRINFVQSRIYFCSSGGLLHELSNDGAGKQFSIFLDNMILPEMVLAAQVSIDMFDGCCSSVIKTCIVYL